MAQIIIQNSHSGLLIITHGIPSLHRAEAGINVIIGEICTACQPEVFIAQQ